MDDDESSRSTLFSTALRREAKTSVDLVVTERALDDKYGLSRLVMVGVVVIWIGPRAAFDLTTLCSV